MKMSAASLSLLLAACSAPEHPANPQQPPQPAPQPTLGSSAQPAPAADARPVGKRAPGDLSPPMTVFRALGTEPFWNANVEGTRLTFTTPDDQGGVVMQGERRALDGGVLLAGNHDGKAFALTLRPGACSDGMSDNRYEWLATFRYGDTDYTGCGEAAK